MNKKLMIALLSLILIIGLVIGYNTLKPQSKSIAELATSSSSSQIESDNFPTLDELKAVEGNELKDLGKVQISTVFFKDVNQAILTTESSEEIKLPLDVTNKENQEFSLSIEYTPDNLRIGDTFGLAKKDNQYFAYTLD